MAAPKILTEELLAEFGGGRGQSTKLRLVVYDKLGARLDLRKFFIDDHGTSVPTSKGVTIRGEWAADIRKALERLEGETAGGA
jgi:hypothetical protein